jgi:hypothetical protein
MDEVHYGERWHSELIAPHVYGHLIFSIFDKAKTNQQVETATATTQQQYARPIIGKGFSSERSGVDSYHHCGNIPNSTVAERVGIGKMG